MELVSEGARVRLSSSAFWPSRPTSFRFEGIHFDFRGSSGTTYVVALNGLAFPIPRLEAHRCLVTGDQSGGLFGYLAADVPDTLHVGELIVSSTTLLNVSRGLALQCSIGRADIDGLVVDGYRRFGLLIGPLRRRQQDRMQGMTLSNVHVSRGIRHSGPNHAGIYLAGRNASLDRFSISDLGAGGEGDTEGLYTKVDSLTVTNGTIWAAGGNQGLISLKGAADGDEASPAGAGTTVRNVVLGVNSGRPGVGIWLQAHGPTLFENVHGVNLSEPFFLMHKAYRGPVTFRECQDYGTTRPFIALRLRPGPRGDNVFRFEECRFHDPRTPDTFITSLDALMDTQSAMIETDGRNSWEGT